MYQIRLLTPEFVVSATRLIVTKYLPLSNEDLMKWDSEPETFVSEEDADQWEFSLRVMNIYSSMLIIGKVMRSKVLDGFGF